MSALATFAALAVNLLTSLLPLLPSTSSISKVIALLQQIIPIAVSEATDLIQPIKNIIAALQSSGAVSTEEFATLAVLQAQADGNFEAAAAADGVPAEASASEPAPEPTAEASSNEAS